LKNLGVTLCSLAMVAAAGLASLAFTQAAVPKLEAAGELDTLGREYLNSVKDEIIWGPKTPTKCGTSNRAGVL
jgi:hypothetical protein